MRSICFRFTSILAASLTTLVWGKFGTFAQEPAVAAPEGLMAQAAAVGKYPPLGIAGSAFNQEFLNRVRKARLERPDLFLAADWPMALADEVAEAFPSFLRQSPPASVSRIRLEGRTAIAPAGAPDTVQRAVTAGNALQTRGYKLGGGRDSLEDWGYDCSGTVSYVLIKAGLLDEPRTSRSFATYGEPGPGRWLTIYASPGHVFMTICGLRLDTGGRGGQGTAGPRWNPYPRPGTGYVRRHPPNF